MNRDQAALVICMVAAGGCSGNAEWPGWARSLEAKLKCGMTVAEVERLADTKLDGLDGGRNRLGTHFLRRGRTDLWFDFAADGLRSVVVTQVVRLKEASVTQRTNVCTGEVSSLVRLYLPPNLVGALVSLDGREVAKARSEVVHLDVPVGGHELRVQNGGQSIAKRVEINLGGPGEVIVRIEPTKTSAS